MNIDIEGLDYEVIKTYSHEHKVPFIMIEDDSIKPFSDSPIRSFMNSINYEPIATSFLTTIYVYKNSKYYDNLFKIGQY